MKRLLNAVLFQTVWFVCLLAGDLWAVLITAFYLFLHDCYFMRTGKEWRLLLSFALLGILIDGTLFHFGVFSSEASLSTSVFGLPIWLMCLWVNVGTLFAHSLAFLRSRYLLCAIVGFIGPTMSYVAGANLADIRLAEPTFMSLLIVAIIWAVVLPFGFWLSEKWALFESQSEGQKIKGIQSEA
jgi:hypothetical protein